jgi:putative methanogen marker protein 4
MDDSFIEELARRARKHRPRIGIGIHDINSDLLLGILPASEYAEIVIVGDNKYECGLEVIPSSDPARELPGLLERGIIDGAVRGNVSASKTMRSISKTFSIKVRRLSLLELPGWSFFLAPVGIDEGQTISDRLDLAISGAEYLRKMSIDPDVSVLSGGRMEDLGRSDQVDRSLADAELIAKRAADAGVSALHKGILIETCKGDDLIVAPDGISGNLIFRTLMLLSGVKGYGAPVIMDKVFVDSSRARKDFIGPIMLASALVSME